MCEGLGSREEFDPELVLGDEQLSLADGLVLPWKGDSPAQAKEHRAELAEFLAASHLQWETPYAEWKPAVREKFLRGNGDGDSNAADRFSDCSRCWKRNSPLQPMLPSRNGWRRFVVKWFVQACGGARLRPEARNVRIGGKAIHEITALTVQQAREFFQPLKSEIAKDDLPIYQPLGAEIISRLAFFDQVGLNYLTLDRPADTLSGGELQRVRLATGIGSGLVGVCYVLDEPSIGLHPRDNHRLIAALRDLQSQGNTVLVVEHDAAMMQQADYLVDMGPGAGAHGGQIVSQGTPAEVTADPNSMTGKYLSGAVSIPVPKQRRKVAKTRSITLEGVTTNNLKNVNARFPLGRARCA